MKATEFNYVVKKQVQLSLDVLVKKADEYATDDRLHNFKVSAELQGITPPQALAGMMAKHSVSIYDMIKNNQVYSIDVWNEKITDHINYLLLLKGLVVEELEH